MHTTRLHFLCRIICAVAPTMGWLAGSVALLFSTTTLAWAFAVNDNAGEVPMDDPYVSVDDPASEAASRVSIDAVVPGRALSDVGGLTPNQRSLAAYLDVFCGSGPEQLGREYEAARFVGACNGLRDPAITEAQVRAALDAINPEPLIVAANTAFGLASMQDENVMHRIAALRSGSRGLDLAGFNVYVRDQHIAGDLLNAVSGPTLGRVLDGMLSDRDVDQRFGLFANGNVRIGDTNGAAVDDSVDMTTGIDYRLRDTIALGASISYASINLENDPNRGALNIESWRGSMFGTYYDKERFHVDGLLAYGSTQYDSLRRIRYGDAQAVATGATNGRQFSAEFTSAFDFRQGPSTFGPRLGAYFLDVDVTRFDEVGAGDYCLTVGRQNARSFRINAGTSLTLALTVPWGVLAPQLTADYVHDLQHRAAAVDVRLKNDPFASGGFDPMPGVALRADRPAAGYFVWSVGASARLARILSSFVTYRSFASADRITSSEITWGVRLESVL